MTNQADSGVEELSRRHRVLTEELCAAVVRRIAERCRRIAPGATSLVYRSDYESDTKSHFPSPVVLIDDIGEEIEVDDASADADALRGDLEILFDAAPGDYLGETHLVFETAGGAGAGRRRVERREIEEQAGLARARLEAAGGRGVELADEVDRLETVLRLTDGDPENAARARKVLFGGEGLLGPDEVCESGYRAVYGLAETAFDAAVADESDPIRAVLADLEGAAEAVAALRRAIEERFPIEVVVSEGAD